MMLTHTGGLETRLNYRSIDHKTTTPAWTVLARQGKKGENASS